MELAPAVIVRVTRSCAVAYPLVSNEVPPANTPRPVDVLPSRGLSLRIEMIAPLVEMRASS